MGHNGGKTIALRPLVGVLIAKHNNTTLCPNRMTMLVPLDHEDAHRGQGRAVFLGKATVGRFIDGSKDGVLSEPSVLFSVGVEPNGPVRVRGAKGRSQGGWTRGFAGGGGHVRSRAEEGGELLPPGDEGGIQVPIPPCVRKVREGSMPVDVAIAKFLDKGPNPRIREGEVSVVVLAICVQGNLLVVADPRRKESKTIRSGGVVGRGGGRMKREGGFGKGNSVPGDQVNGVIPVIGVVLRRSGGNGDHGALYQDIVVGDRHKGAGREGFGGIIRGGDETTVDAAIVGEAEEISRVARGIKAVVGGDGDTAGRWGPEHHAITLVTATHGNATERVGFKLFAGPVGVPFATKVPG